MTAQVHQFSSSRAWPSARSMPRRPSAGNKLVNEFVNVTRRNCRDGMKRGVIGEMGDWR